jgi:hypothetical protein
MQSFNLKNQSVKKYIILKNPLEKFNKPYFILLINIMNVHNRVCKIHIFNKNFFIYIV